VKVGRKKNKRTFDFLYFLFSSKFALALLDKHRSRVRKAAEEEMIKIYGGVPSFSQFYFSFSAAAVDLSFFGH